MIYWIKHYVDELNHINKHLYRKNKKNIYLQKKQEKNLYIEKIIKKKSKKNENKKF